MTAPAPEVRATGRAWVAALTVLLAFAVGLWAGRRTVEARARRPFEELSAEVTLGRALADPARKQGAAMAYLDPAAALREMDSYAWSVPNDPAPFVGSVPTPGVHGNARIDAHGFRSDYEVERAKAPRTRRFFFTGGSNAFGVGAPSRARTVGGYLEAELGGESELVIAANPAWASTHERILIENRLGAMSPDVVIALSGNNDVHWGWSGEDSGWMLTYADALFADAIARARGTPAPARVERAPVASALVAARLAKNARLSALALAPGGAIYVLALQPSMHASRKRLSPRERELARGQSSARRDYFVACYEELRRLGPELAAAGARFVDLSRAFDDLGEESEIFIDPYHTGDRGNRIVALALAAALRETGVLR